MSHQNETPAGGPGLGDMSLPCIIDGFENAPKAHVAQAKGDLLADDVVDTAGWLIDQLNCLPAQRAAGDVTGMIYTLRRSRAFWIAISGSAKELVERNDELISALRQGEAPSGDSQCR
jgi:hypothetical protein